MHPEALSAGPVREALVHLLRLGQVPLSDLVELRRVLEGSTAVAAAHRRTDSDLIELAHWIDAMRAAVDDVGAFEKADVGFHLALASASGNEAVHLVMLAVRDSIGTHLLESLRADPDPNATLRRLLAEHEQLVAAIEQQHADEARQLVEAHIVGFYDRLRTA